MSAHVLSLLELRVKEKIGESNTPYVGLIPELLSEDHQAYIKKSLSGTAMSFKNMAVGLDKYPALFVAFIVESIQSNLGAGSTGAVYGCLNMAMDKPLSTENSPAEKHALWVAFRKACQKLGLPVSNRLFGSNFMVDAYLDQAGVFDSAREEVEDRFHRFAKKNGVPDLFDTVESQNWYQSFCESLHQSFPVRVRRALTNDTSLYYLSEFVNNVDHDVQLSAAQAQGFEARGVRYSETKLPKLCFDSQNLKLVFSGNPEEEWQAEVDDSSHLIELEGNIHSLFLEALAIQRIVAIGPSGQKCEFNLWADDKDNQIAFFNAESEQLVATHSLAEEGVALAPGKYTVLSRFPISEDWLDTHESFESGFHIGSLSLKSGQKWQIVKGPAKFDITAHSQASMSIEGDIFSPLSGEDFYAASSVGLAIDFPIEWTDDTQYSIEIHVRATGEKQIVDVSVDGENLVLVKLEAEGSNWSPCFSRVLVKLRARDQLRVLAQSSFLAWFGLSSIDSGFKPNCSVLPGNFDRDESDNILVDEDSQQLVIQDESQPFVKLGFRTAENSDRYHRYTFTQPGTYLYISDPSDGSQRQNQLIKGSTLAGNYSDNRVVRIHSTVPGELWLGNRMLHDFDTRASVPFRLATLLDIQQDAFNESSNVVSIHYRDPEYREELLKLVSPHDVSNWAFTVLGQDIELVIDSVDEIESIRLNAVELLSRKKHDIECIANDGRQIGKSGALKGMLLWDHASTLMLDCRDLEDGVWYFEVGGKIRGRWGSFINRRKDFHSFGLIVRNGEVQENLIANDLRGIKEFDLDDGTQSLRLVNNVLRNCFSPSCWPSLSFISEVWKSLVTDSRLTGEGNVRRVISLTESVPDETSSSTWVPLLHIGGFNPYIYSHDAVFYRKIDAIDSLNLRCLRLMSACNDDLTTVVKEHRISLEPIFAFVNARTLENTNEKPRNFNVVTFGRTISVLQPELLRTPRKKPGASQLLSAAHLGYVQTECIKHWRRSDQGLIHSRPLINTLALNFAKSNENKIPLLVDDEFFVNEQEKETISSLLALASGLAKICRENVRDSGVLVEFLHASKSLVPTNEVDMRIIWSLFFSIAGEAFHFHLLMWEIYFGSRES